MTVSAATPAGSVVYAGVDTIPYTYRILAASDMVVAYDGVGKTLGIDFTVSGVNNPSGGTITLIGTKPTLGQTVTHYRATSRVRTLDYQTLGDFLASQFNYDLDRLWHAVQELATTAAGGSSISVPPYEYGNFGLVLPAAADRALKALTFDAAGNILMIPTADLGVVWGSLPVATSLAELDRVIFYDVSDDLPKTITNESLIGRPLGDGMWRVAAGQVLTANTPATLALAAAVTDQLQRGAFNLGTYTYTAAESVRVLVAASVGITMGNGEMLTVEIRKNSTTIASGKQQNEITSGTSPYIVSVTGYAALAQNDTITIRVTCTGNRTTDSAADACFMALVEL